MFVFWIIITVSDQQNKCTASCGLTSSRTVHGKCWWIIIGALPPQGSTTIERTNNIYNCCGYVWNESNHNSRLEFWDHQGVSYAAVGIPHL